MNSVIVGFLVAMVLLVAVFVSKIRNDSEHHHAQIAAEQAAYAATHPHPDGGSLRVATMREWYAGQALIGIKSRYGSDPEGAAKEAWAMADAMIAAEAGK